MKVYLFSVAPVEEPFVKEWQDQHPDDEISYTHSPLTASNLELAKGFEAVSTQQAEALKDAELKALAAGGVKHLALRKVGSDNVDLAAARKYGIVVSNVPAYSPRAIAENGLTGAMYLLRKWGYYHRKMRRGDFTRPTELMSDEIFNQTVGIVGLGRIGAAAAEMYHALGARVIGYDPFYNASLEPFLDFVDFDTLIKESDIIQLHIPLTPENKGMFGTNEFAKMKDDAILVNQSRGELVDTEALIVALKYHEIGGAALDVLEGEEKIFGRKFEDVGSLPDEYTELINMPNVVMSPHSAYYTKMAVKNMFFQSMTDTQRTVSGQQAFFKVN
ncbi:D-lactate dehydrogenase [Lactobacillus nasalidis]|uniref:D-lactate dehydrogenase n=1 Tax=Lactobacillus nasalidis TaxID=2797258 RepID=A0ABQ3W2T7_9LACO|nr:D-2-hydroxyacid dehydrogenase [Lactobacillus nasalidis]GHV98124.1 D-lactate dehydrogenase [Lactobacillus nasalidis]GHV99320.1 D-lactate dehydrogenase [Lactobacillus nasalidis]GHW00638.1 D-lactate dehydrogenase [Lactobacillus nasalidis]